MFENFKKEILSIKNIKRKDIKKIAFRFFLIILGSFALAFGTAIFLVPNNIVSGGLSGIGIIIGHFAGSNWIDIVVLIADWVLFFIGLFVLGTKFALHTLIATIIYPLALMLFMRVGVFQDLASRVVGIDVDGKIIDTGLVMLSGLFGGAFTGLGCALTFLGNGTTGGIDILCFIVRKYTGIKQSISSFVFDTIIIICGMFVIPNNFVPGLVGVLGAFAAALVIEFVYIKNNTSYMAEIISTDWEEINRFIQDEVGRGTTIVTIKGGWKGTEHQMIKVTFSKKEYLSIKDAIAEIDPFAFVTFTQTEAVYGEGFENHRRMSLKKHKKNKQTDDNNDKTPEN